MVETNKSGSVQLANKNYQAQIVQGHFWLQSVLPLKTVVKFPIRFLPFKSIRVEPLALVGKKKREISDGLLFGGFNPFEKY